MSFEIKPNRIDSQDEIVALIEEIIPAATPTTQGIVFGATDSSVIANVGLGKNSLASVSTGRQLVAIGTESLMNTTNDSVANTAVGFGSLKRNTTGNSNTALGTFSLSQNTTGSFSVAIGVSSLSSNTSGERNVGVGIGTLAANTTGFRNIAIGESALYSNTTGSGNTAIGWSAGAGGVTDRTGSNNTIIGYEATSSSLTVSNEITLGNSSITTLRAQVTSITSLSDARDKKNIESLPTGLDFVNSLNPVKFDWNMRDGGKVDVPDTGFIAQDLVKVEDATGIADYLKLTFRDNPDKLEASYGRLVPVLVKAIQDLSAKVTELEEKLNG